MGHVEAGATPSHEHNTRTTIRRCRAQQLHAGPTRPHPQATEVQSNIDDEMNGRSSDETVVNDIINIGASSEFLNSCGKYIDPARMSAVGEP